MPPRQFPCTPAHLFILPKGPVGFAVALFVFSPCRYPKAELRTYQSISVVKRDLSAGRAGGISQVGVGVVDGESTQTWQGDRDTAEAVRGEHRAGHSGGSGSGSVRDCPALARGCGALATPRPWGHLVVRDRTAAVPCRPPGPRAHGTQIRLFSTLWAFPLHRLPGGGRNRCMEQQRTRASEGSQHPCPGTSGHVQMCTGCRGWLGCSEEQPSVGAAPLQPG